MNATIQKTWKPTFQFKTKTLLIVMLICGLLAQFGPYWYFQLFPPTPSEYHMGNAQRFHVAPEFNLKAEAEALRDARRQLIAGGNAEGVSDQQP